MYFEKKTVIVVVQKKGENDIEVLWRDPDFGINFLFFRICDIK